MARKRYTSAFKEEACKLVSEQGYEVVTAARQLGIAEQTLRYWLVRSGWEGPKAVGLEEKESDDPKYLKARVRDLEQRLKRAEMEREILKKRRPTSRARAREVRLDSSSSPGVYRACDVPGAERNRRRVLPMACSSAQRRNGASGHHRAADPPVA